MENLGCCSYLVCCFGALGYFAEVQDDFTDVLKELDDVAFELHDVQPWLIRVGHVVLDSIIVEDMYEFHAHF